ncbi:hypothetical protein LIER_06829 [Lithospermum erythrorhizon]|uniref:Pentatricopeptide repeat-containing protein n=1 Tax=Lithospermum erythrorhizon TaxID=34254 RepID=A0AAV3P767_LITER
MAKKPRKTSSSENEGVVQKFNYSRASPSVRFPHLNYTDNPSKTRLENNTNFKEVYDEIARVGEEDLSNVNDEGLEVLGRTKAKKMTKLALKRAKDWRKRVQFLTHRILQLKPQEFVADVLDDKIVQMTPTDFCYVVKSLGQSSWPRALEVYEWLNLRHWYSPNARMLATIVAVLGKANQEALAVEIFSRAEPSVGNTVQVYNAMMGVYARYGQFSKVQELLALMKERDCTPDLVSFNTLINARLRSGPMSANMGTELLNEVRRSGVRPDMITYNTLISACSRESKLEEALKLFADMQASKCQPDLWTYNAMISVFGRCGLARKAERLFKELQTKGFLPDTVTYNSLLYAFAKEGNIDKVKEVGDEMVKMGFGKDEMTYNTIIHMYEKRGQHDLALQVYKDMKNSGRCPDVVTYTVLIDALGKASKMNEAASVMTEMLNAGVKPSLRTYSALICGYAKAGMRLQAEDIFECMRRSGIRPDHLAYSVMLDTFVRSNDVRKAMMLYHDMLRDGFTPDSLLYESLLRVLGGEKAEESIQKVIKDMEEISNLTPHVISSILSKAGCFNYALKSLRLAISEGYELDYVNILSILSSYSTSGRFSEAIEFLNFLKEHSPSSQRFVTEALVTVLCKACQLDAALDEYQKNYSFYLSDSGFGMYDTLLRCCAETDQYATASQIYSDMLFNGVEPSDDVCRIMCLVYCKMGFPETAHNLLHHVGKNSSLEQDISLCVALIEAYGKLRLLEKVEDVVGCLRQKRVVVDRKVWNALVEAYASSGCYEKARAAFNTMMRDGPSPTVDTINSLLQALVVDGRLSELYVVIQELQDMGFKISKSSIVLMLDAFAKAENIFEVKKIYQGMRAAGYFPTMHLYRVMIRLFTKGKRVRDVEAMVSEMDEADLKPDISIWNSMLKLYTTIDDYKKTVQVYHQMKEDGVSPDEETYNTLIVMYCRDHRPDEGLLLMHTMQSHGLNPRMDTYKSLIAALAKQLMVEQAEELFESIKSEGRKLDRSFYHLMMKMYRSCENHSKAEKLLVMMKDSGVEPTIATMHLLMTSYSSSGHPAEAEEVLNRMESMGSDSTTLTYSSVIGSYLKNGDYNVGIQKLLEMKAKGISPDHRVWTCFVRASSLCQTMEEAMMLLQAIKSAGLDLPVRLLTENSESLVMELNQYFEKLQPLEDDAALNFVNALEDLLWAFEQRATASWVFQLALKNNIYHHSVYRVADKDWGADFRKLSGAAALVGLTLWLDHMQDASLEGFPESPKSVVLITGTSRYNNISLNSTVKIFLWEMGSPFLPCKTRSGLLIAKAHSLRMWLKDSPFCLDLELKNSPTLPETNSMQLVDGCFVRRGLVPALKDINERLGLIGPRKFSRLALLSDEKRDKIIQAEIVGREEKLAKLKKKGIPLRKRVNKFRRNHHVREKDLSRSNNT